MFLRADRVIFFYCNVQPLAHCINLYFTLLYHVTGGTLRPRHAYMTLSTLDLRFRAAWALHCIVGQVYPRAPTVLKLG